MLTPQLPSQPPSQPTDLRARLLDRPDGILEHIAQEHGVTLLECLRALPPGMIVEHDGARFEDVLGQIATWGEVTTIVHTPDVIMEFSGPFPHGKAGHGFYNLRGKGGLTGHLRVERCHKVVFLERPFMGLRTAGVLFINPEGGCMFKVFIRRLEDRSLDATQLATLRALASQP